MAPFLSFGSLILTILLSNVMVLLGEISDWYH